MLKEKSKETPDIRLDIRRVNGIVKTLSDDWEKYQNGNGALPSGHGIDYVVLTNEGAFVAATRLGLNEHINDAVRNRDTIVDIVARDKIVGKVIFFNDTARIIQDNRAIVVFYLTIMLRVLLLILVAYTVYFYYACLKKIKKMQGFARYIAAGNFDIPLEMDKNNLFGAFTESFDLMREELHKAKEKEREADRSKKELVASLSHDIKTPVASIKSATELMLFTTDNEEYKEQLEGINAKAEQINHLVTNMFQSTLEELQALSVSAAEIPSAAIPDIIRFADYERRVKPYKLPDCLVLADLQRLEQVFDNIIGNSYKYAGTDIEINAFFEGQYLAIDITDSGAGVPEEELPLIFTKFYRGKDAAAKSGYGLGLYISKYLMEQMAGGIRCENRLDGFSVRLMLRLAG
jgi:signal transduction histidine kinase